MGLRSRRELASTGGAGSSGRVSLVIVVRNEQDTICDAIRQADSALAALAVDHEIIVVDDASTDSTPQQIEQELALNNRLRLVRHQKASGYGGALRSGTLLASGDLVALASGEPLGDESQWAHLLQLAGSEALVCARRGAGPLSVLGRISRWAYDSSVRALTGCSGHDPGTVLTLLGRQHLSRVQPQLDSGFACAEVLCRARSEGLAVIEVAFPPGAKRAGRPANTFLRALPACLASLLRFWWSDLLFPARSAKPATWRGWSWGGLALLALLAGWLLLGKLAYPLLEPDEGRYAEVAREMAATGDWIVPRLQGTPFYDKPPLFYWLLGASYRVFGIHDWSARLVPAVAAWLTILACYLLGWRMIGTRAAFLGALVLSLTIGFVQCGRIIILDSLLTLFVTLSWLTAYEALAGEVLQRAWWLASAACCAMGIAIKGPIAAVLLIPPLVLHLWLYGRLSKVSWRDWARYGGLVALLVAPPYVALIARDPRFAHHFFIDQHLVRFFLREYHVQPAWYYIPVLLAACLPWSFLLLPLTRFLLSGSSAARAHRSEPLGFLLLCAVWCVVFFSVSSSKLPPYILPALPAIAMLLGCYIELQLRGRPPAAVLHAGELSLARTAALAQSGFWLLAVIGAWYSKLMGSAAASVHLAVAAACAATLALGPAGKRRQQLVWLACAAVGVLVCLGVAHEIVPAWASRRCPLKRYPEIGQLVQQDQIPVVCYEGEWGSIPFYLQRIEGITNLSSHTVAELPALLVRQPHVLLIVRHKSDLERIRQETAPFMNMSRTLFADEIGVGFLDASPWWQSTLSKLPAEVRRLESAPSKN